MKGNLRIHRVVNSFFTSNSYIVSGFGDDEAIMVDCGDWEPALDYLRDNGLRLTRVFITHGHFDHIYGLNALIAECPDVKIYASEDGRRGLYSEKLNYSKYHDREFVFEGDEVTVLHGGDRVELNHGAYIEVLHTPGHDSGCLSYVLSHGDETIVFTGDAYIPGIKVVTNLRGNKEQAARSEKMLRALIDERGMTACPGHGEIIDINRQ